MGEREWIQSRAKFVSGTSSLHLSFFKSQSAFLVISVPIAWGRYAEERNWLKGGNGKNKRSGRVAKPVLFRFLSLYYHFERVHFIVSSRVCFSPFRRAEAFFSSI